MKNLVLLKEQHYDFKNTVDICHVDDGIQESAVILAEDGSLFARDAWKQKLCSSGWFRITFVDPQIVCLSRQGAIASVQPESGEWELVGEFDNGILDGSWSPDAEVLALITITESESGNKNCVLLTMSAEFDVLEEVVLEPFDVNAQVTIGWRPDGTLLAVNSLEISDNTRRIRSYQRESLALNSIGRSEDGSGKTVQNLQSPLAWACGGCSNLIASVQRKSKRTQQVVFFEPNGLRHREFVLRSSPQSTSVKSLCWNAQSDILTVLMEKENGSSQLQLWHRSNYHWYLKYEWQYAQKVRCVEFHNEQPYRLFVAFAEEMREYICCWDVSTYHVTGDSFTAFAIDGQNLNITPFHKALVPPPMYASTISFDHSVRIISFNKDVSVVYLSNGSLAIVSKKNHDNNGGNSSFDPTIEKEMIEWDNDLNDTDVQTLRHIVIVNAKETHLDLIAAAPCNRLVEIKICFITRRAIISNKIVMENPILRIVNWSDCSNGALIELEDGEFLEYVDGDILPSSIEPLLEPCPWIAGIYHGSAMDEHQDMSYRTRLIVGLSTRSRLYCHDRLLADSVSSFILSTSHQFLYFITSGAHFHLRSLALITLHNFDPFMGSEENDMEGYEIRNVERGARLVAILPSSPTAILQMPRGNLEGTYPRSLVLPFVMSKIESGQYGSAVSMMRRQKVDLNLAVDLNPVEFLQDGIIEFVEEIRQVDILNLFISTLQNVDVTKMYYKVPSWFKRVRMIDEISPFDPTTKVNMVCQRMRELLIQAEERGSTLGGAPVEDGYYLLPILSTFAKELPPKLEEALAMIRENATKQRNVKSKKSRFFSDKTQSSIQYLAFLANYELLFNTSLGMYDYELARAIARNSQMDPKVYLPLLKRLKKLPDFFAKYEVDIHLKRYELALSNLHQSCVRAESLNSIEPTEDKIFGNSFSQCLELVEKYKLHRLGLKLYHQNSEKRSQIMQSLGKHLLNQGKSQSALSVFLSVEPPDLERAKQAARHCGDWKYFFTLSLESSSETDSILNYQLAHEIADEIAEGKNGASRREALLDASRILLDYGSDIAGSIDFLTSAEMWSEGFRIATQHSRDDLVKRVTDAAVSYASSRLTDFEERQSTFKNTSLRYVEVLKIRQQALKESGLEEGEMIEEGDDNGSLFSVASTSSLRSTASTGSVGSVASVASVSSVISLGNQSTFTMTSELDRDKHKSKFNSIGKKKKKKKKKKSRRNPGSRKIRPGSEGELQNLVGSLEYACVKTEYASIIGDAILFLSQVGHIDLSQQLFSSYETLRKSIESCQTDRIEESALERLQMERTSRREGIDETPLTLKCEAKVDALLCEQLSMVLHELFSFL